MSFFKFFLSLQFGDGAFRQINGGSVGADAAKLIGQDPDFGFERSDLGNFRSGTGAAVAASFVLVVVFCESARLFAGRRAAGGMEKTSAAFVCTAPLVSTSAGTLLVEELTRSAAASTAPAGAVELAGKILLLPMD